MSTRPIARSLVSTSIDIIEANQASTGAYPAAPTYETYRYSWLRDGAFIALAMDSHGRHDSAAAFHDWAARAVERYSYKVDSLVSDDRPAEYHRDGTLRPLDDRFTLHTRFTLGGEEASDRWGNFQLDGYGFWLTSVARHLATTKRDARPYRRAIELVQRYLLRLWDRRCYDSWEEYPTRRHMSTWAAVAEGLRASAEITRSILSDEVSAHILGRIESIVEPANVLRKFVPEGTTAGSALEERQRDPQADAAVAGHEREGRDLDPNTVDGSSLLVIGPMGPYRADSRIGRATVQEVTSALVVDGGVHRYIGDEFYGGGLWVVLAGSLATAVAPTDPAQARGVVEWIESTADVDGFLPEQVDRHLLEPGRKQAWEDRWGPVAQPLLWSHAMYLLASAAARPKD